MEVQQKPCLLMEKSYASALILRFLRGLGAENREEK
jgi:hypothetical protein